MTDVQVEPAGSSPPEINQITLSTLAHALRLGWRDFRAAPMFGLFFAGVYVLSGLLMAYVTQRTGQSYWLVLAAFGFPLFGPFAAVGLYEVSRQLEKGAHPEWRAVLGCVWRQKDRQVPSICAITVFIFLFWFFIAHMIFALFLGLTTMTNISNSLDVFLTLNGMTMLLVGSGVGAALAFLIFSITATGLPLLLDREIDYVTAMIVSVQSVTRNLPIMLVWGGMVAILLFVGMVPAFLGLMVVLPVLGHATWHLYRAVLAPAE